MLRKVTVAVLLISLVLSGSPQVWAATPLQKLEEVEVSLFGSPKGGALLQRLNNAEATLFGKPVSTKTRLWSSGVFVQVGNGKRSCRASLIMKLNAAGG